jgi:hypothetical protein
MTESTDPYAPPKARLGPDEGKGKLRPHQKAARVLRLMGWLVLVLGGAMAVAIGYPMWMGGGGFGGDAVPFLVFALIVAGMTGALFATAHGLFAKSGWARPAGILLGVLMLFGFPIWTLVGAYVLFQLTWAWEKAGE